MDDRSFKKIGKAIYLHAGIVIDETKRELVYSRMARRLRTLQIPDFATYIEFLESDAGKKEMPHLISALTTNHTRFFRELHHFEFIQKEIIPYWIKRAQNGGKKRLRIWSAASSTGEEPYTLAMVIAHGLRDKGEWDWKILATDIDRKVLATAKAGEYPLNIKSEIPAQYSEYINIDRARNCVAVMPQLKRRVIFNGLNLHGAWPMEGMFDLILCRNVVIYFDPPSKAALIERFCEKLNPDGWFFLGHSESLLGDKAPLRLVGRTMYEPLNASQYR